MVVRSRYRWVVVLQCDNVKAKVSQVARDWRDCSSSCSSHTRAWRSLLLAWVGWSDWTRLGCVVVCLEVAWDPMIDPTKSVT